MAETEKFKAMKRYGARYGRTVKQNFGIIEKEQRKKHPCPYCHANAVRRKAVGIWNCKKCDATFTGRAYTLTSQKTEEAQNG